MVRVSRSIRLSAGLAAVLLVAACGTASSGTGSSPAAKDSYRVGVLQMAEATVLDDTVTAFEHKLSALLAPKKVAFELKNAQGDQSLVGGIARDFAGSDDDAFGVIGTPAVIALAQQVRDRPIFAIAMGDPVGSGVAKSLTTPGGNVTGSIDYVDPALLLDQILKIAPAPKRIGTVYDPSNKNMQVWVDALRKAVAAHSGLSLVESSIAGAADVPSGARGLVGRSDAILIGPDATVFAGLAAVGSTAAAARLPVYVSGGDATVPGILASIGPDYPVVGELAAASAAKVLTGTKPGEVAFGQPNGVEFEVNKTTMDSLPVTVPQDILAKAVVK
ncbi:ABC transporter substrate-binding protein [Amycolatopsis acididurans]|uniref:ABC transporter substrate-binding protein n=1 Tax=Amycolatopsis acididurans TaxID=2724524 RepID=UPI0028A6FF66|nr:ABC transporter substrate-binding protein [Amycolatopsis acididurans]